MHIHSFSLYADQQVRYVAYLALRDSVSDLPQSVAPQAFAVEEGGHDRLQMELRHQIENACSADRFTIFVQRNELAAAVGGQFLCS